MWLLRWGTSRRTVRPRRGWLKKKEKRSLGSRQAVTKQTGVSRGVLNSPTTLPRCQIKADTEFPWRKPRRLQGHPTLSHSYGHYDTCPEPRICARGSPGERPNCSPFLKGPP